MMYIVRLIVVTGNESLLQYLCPQLARCCTVVLAMSQNYAVSSYRIERCLLLRGN